MEECCLAFKLYGFIIYFIRNQCICLLLLTYKIYSTKCRSYLNGFTNMLSALMNFVQVSDECKVTVSDGNNAIEVTLGGDWWIVLWRLARLYDCSEQYSIKMEVISVRLDFVLSGLEIMYLEWTSTTVSINFLWKYNNIY